MFTIYSPHVSTLYTKRKLPAESVSKRKLRRDVVEGAGLGTEDRQADLRNCVLTMTSGGN
jgi:hypothetical protein